MPPTGAKFPTLTPRATWPFATRTVTSPWWADADDVLNVGGLALAPPNVEGALVSHPAVAEAAVIGRPDKIKGENIKAFVILRVGHTASPELEAKLKDHVRHVLGSIAVPAEVAFPDKLPKTRSGKIIRRLLKAQEYGPRGRGSYRL